MDIYLRFVCAEDVRTLYEWRIDPTTRKFAHSVEEFPYDSHLEWFESSLVNPNRNMFVATDDKGNLVGQLRFDRNGEFAEIDVAVSPEMRGKGIGADLLKLGCHHYFSNWNIDCLLAEIRIENVASIKIFEKSGFEEYERDDEIVKMRAYS